MDREIFTMRLVHCGIPDYMHEGILEYLLEGRPVGHFLTAFLTNDLAGACHSADETNCHLLYNYWRFFRNYAPMECWGDVDRVNRWRGHRGLLDEALKNDPRER